MSSELQRLDDDGQTEDGSTAPVVDEPYDQRPDLTSIGIIEIEKGVCEDSYDNRRTLRNAKLRYQPVFDNYGRATGLISAFSPEAALERRIISLAEKRPLMVDPDNRDSDYITGLELILEEDVHNMVPPWVLGATRAWMKEQNEGGPSSPRQAPKGLPARCRAIKPDGIRCMLWGSGRIKDDGLCRIHLKVARKPGEDVERARRKLVQAAPYAVDTLEELMEGAESEPVRLKASTEILDRAGVRGGQDISIDVEVSDNRPASEVIMERLSRLADGAAAIQHRLEEAERGETGEIIEAEVVEEAAADGEIETITPVEEVPPARSATYTQIESTTPVKPSQDGPTEEEDGPTEEEDEDGSTVTSTFDDEDM